MLMDDHDDDADDDADDEAADRTMIAAQMTRDRWGSGYALLPDTHQPEANILISLSDTLQPQQLTCGARPTKGRRHICMQERWLVSALAIPAAARPHLDYA